MTKLEFLNLPTVNIGNILLDIADFDDQSDRTLFLANVITDTEMVTHHTYVQNQVLHVLVTNSMTGEVRSYVTSRELSAGRLVPDQILNPVVTDFAAAELLMNMGYPIEFIQDYDRIPDFYTRPYCSAVHSDLESVESRKA